MGFFSNLETQVLAYDSCLCVGLDPHMDDLPEPTALAARDFCLRLIDATQGLAVAYKPNAAFFESFGAEGWVSLQQVIVEARAHAPVILDAKRGDIASTAAAYARAAFYTLGVDAITINPYLGEEAIAPFLADPERGAFVLCKTSNPGAAQLQDLEVVRMNQESGLVGERGESLYERVARLANEWNKQDNLGLVVGATQPESLARVRRISPDLWILAPGVGAQGGDLEAAMQAGLRGDGLGMLLPVSRAISRAEKPREAADSMRIAINRARISFLQKAKSRITHEAAPRIFQSSNLLLRQDSLVAGLLASGCVQFGKFTLKSGLVSPIYIDLRRLVGFPALLVQVASAYLPVLRRLEFTRMAAIPYAALPIATAISILCGWPMVYPRKEVKSYGTQVEVEGDFIPQDQVVVIDDLATTGGSKFEAIARLTQVGLKVKDVVVLIDRQSGAEEALKKAGYRLHAVYTLTQLLDLLEQAKAVPVEQIASVRKFLSQSGKSSP